MSIPIRSTPKSEFRLFLELGLVLGLPLLAVFAASTLAIVAYTKGFTALPEPAAASVQHR
jgi:hypothetical protein